MREIGLHPIFYPGCRDSLLAGCVFPHLATREATLHGSGHGFEILGLGRKTPLSRVEHGKDMLSWFTPWQNSLTDDSETSQTLW